MKWVPFNRLSPVTTHQYMHILPHFREVIIDFGAAGYIARFRYENGGDIYIVRIKHQREDELGP